MQTAHASLAAATLLVANLAAEHRLLRASAARRGVFVPPLPAAIRRALACAGTLMRVFAAAHDRLWLEAPLAPARLVAQPGLPVPRLVSGPWPPRATQRVRLWAAEAALCSRRPPAPGSPLPWRRRSRG